MGTVTTPCYVWPGKHHPYGRIRVGENTTIPVHVLIWTAVNGPLEPGEKVCHHCDNPPCYRYDHLFKGTQADNMADCAAKGRRPRFKGEANSRHKLTGEDVLVIRERYAGGALQRVLAAEYDVTQVQISAIVRGKAWAHLPGALLSSEKETP